MEIETLAKVVDNSSGNTNDFGTLASGVRYKHEFDTPDFLREKLSIILKDYLGPITISPFVRLYKQLCGSIKPHRDKSLYGDFKYTCLIYLADDFECGELSLKVPNQ